MSRQTEEYFCTRPRLAAFLMEKGFSGERTMNPFKPERAAWVFKRTPELSEALDDFFKGGSK